MGGISFSPVAAHISRGVPLETLGTTIVDPIILDLPEPVRIRDTLIGEVIHIDHFGNLSTNIRLGHLGKHPQVKFHIQAHSIDGMVDTFGERPIGSLIALYGSTGNLIISQVNGSAATLLGAHVGDIVTVEFSPKV
jgi:S-adenosylmethionine hydrolase